MARTPQDVTDAELSVLLLLWEHGPATIRQLTDRLHPGGGVSQYATVQKLLERLEEKQFVARRRTGLAHTFEATVNRDELIGRRLQSVAEKLCGGSVTPLLTHLVKTQRLSPEERAELRALIDEPEEKKTNRKGRR
jgi:predicted transcriptional regulator